jgi:LysR family positive regulator for ilvC
VLERSPFREDVVQFENVPQLDPYVVGLCSSKRNLQRPSVSAFWKMTEDRAGGSF